MRWVCWCILGTAVWAAAADRPLIFPEPQKLTLRQDGFAVDEQVPVVIPESASAGDLSLAPPTDCGIERPLWPPATHEC